MKGIRATDRVKEREPRKITTQVHVRVDKKIEDHIGSRKEAAALGPLFGIDDSQLSDLGGNPGVRRNGTGVVRYTRRDRIVHRVCLIVPLRLFQESLEGRMARSQKSDPKAAQKE